MPERPPQSNDRPLPAGTALEVYNQFTGRWTTGFTVDDIGPGGYRLRRRSDASVLPDVFTGDAVRPTR